MGKRVAPCLLPALLGALLLTGCATSEPRWETGRNGGTGLVLPFRSPSTPGAAVDTLRLDGMYLETGKGRELLSGLPALKKRGIVKEWWEGQIGMSDGRVVTLAVEPRGSDYVVRFSATPNTDVIRWGFALEATADEYFTGLMERVVDGPQQASWARGIRQAMDLRGQKVEMKVNPTTSVYAPFYLSSRGYGVFAQTNWPGAYDFCVSDPNRVQITFDGPSLEVKVYTTKSPVQLVQAHALEAGPPFLPPRWTYAPIRWRDEHTQRATYYDGTPVTGPFNAEVMEDMLMMKAYGIPCGVYWVDRPWGPGRQGYDDFEIDPNRLPNFEPMVQWLNSQGTQAMLWIAPFFQGKMATEAIARDYNLPGQRRPAGNYPLCDFTNPQAKAYWQAGLAKLFKMGVAAYKLDRSEEDIPDSGPYHVFDGRSVRENRNAYPAMYLKAAYDVGRKYRGDDFFMMPRAAYTGSAAYGVFWGGDIGGVPEGLRASIIAVQRAAVLGYPNWGSDTCGYSQQSVDRDMCARWLAFSCFTPIMEVGPTRNLAFWDFPRDAGPRAERVYESELIAVWRLYARLHQRLMDYSYTHAKAANKTGMPIVRPLFLIEPKAAAAWSNWWTYEYGPDLLVAPIWEKGKRRQGVYLPSGQTWRDAWRPDRIYQGGQSITVEAELHQIPLFVRVGSDVQIGDLNKEYRESQAIAEKRPDLKALDAEVKAWFEKKAGSISK